MKLNPIDIESLLDKAFNLIDCASKYVLIFGVIFFVSIVVRLIFKI